jgi:diguanylate cyclase (GGDEF)-like protein/PAS domain S-box-containing protein
LKLNAAAMSNQAAFGRRPTFIAIVVLFAFGALATTAYTLWRLRAEAIDRQLDTAAMTARAFEDHLTQSFNIIASTLGNAAAGQGDTLDLRQALRNAPYLRSIALLDARDNIVASSEPRNVGLHLARGDYLPLVDGPSEVLRTGALRDGRDFYETHGPGDETAPPPISFIPVALDLRRDDDGWTAAMATVNTDYFLGFYANRIGPEQGVVQLLRYDGSLLLSSDEQAAPLSLGSNRGIPALVANSEAGRFTETLADGRTMFTAYRASRAYPFILVVRLDKDYGLAGWRQEALRSLGIVATVLLAALALATLYFIRFERVAREREHDQERLLTLSRAISQSPVSIVITDPRGNIQYTNPKFEQASGYGSAEVLGQNPRIFSSGEKSPAEYAAMWTAITSGQTWQGEFHNKRKDGSLFWELASISPVFNDKGSLLHFVAVKEDITARKAAEEKLHLLASVFTHAREGILITSADGRIIDANEAFTRITGYHRDEVLGLNPRILNSGRQEKAYYARMWQELAEKGYWYGEVWNRHKNGELYAVMQTISTVRDAQGTPCQYVALFSDITPIKEHERQLERIAHYDALTTLPNRVLLADRLHQAMAQAQRHGKMLAVAYLDLDGFKSVNDEHGHKAGDQLLVALATRMRHALREGDTLARLGGDEFVAVLLDLGDVSASVPMLSRLLAAAAQPVQAGGLALQVSASIGVTYYPQAEDVDADQLLRQADQSMYQAKVAGKNRYHIFDAELDRSVRGHHESQQRIRRALYEGEFELHYQPKVNMRSGAVIGAEALIRWQHPEHGQLPPAAFLPYIEDHPLAVELGEWVIDNALGQMSAWRAIGLDIPISINVGARQLQQPDFVTRLGNILAAHPNVAPEMLELEVLETSALEDLARISQVIEECREIGVKFALDDFGTGYSSLTYLKRLPVTQLKIDQSFVRGMLDDPDDLAILDGVIGLAAAFRREVVAEGVEAVEHGAMLLRLGCECAQGYVIARPMPAAEFPAWAANWQPDPAWRNCPAVSRDDLQVLFASVEHRAWILAMGAFLCGERRDPPPQNHHECRFGQWLDGEGLIRHGGHPAFPVVDALHRQVHELGHELLQLHQHGDNSQARQRLGELDSLQALLLGALKRLIEKDAAV